MLMTSRANSGVSIGFPDVCKTPAPQGGVPIPYPNIATTALKSQQKAGSASYAPVAQKTVAQKTVLQGVAAGGKLYSFGSFPSVNVEGKDVARHEAIQLQNRLNQANAKLQALKTSDPNEWQKVLVDYAVLASALYRTLYPDD